MKVFLRYFCFCMLLLVLLSFQYNYTSDADYALIEKEVDTEDTLAMRDLEYFKQEHGKDRKAMLFYRIMRTHVFLHKGKEVSLDSVERWTAEAKETGDSLLYAKSLETLSACHAARGELAQALSAQQRACGVTSHANAAFALHIRYVIALLAVVLCIGIALCLTFLHLYKREKTGKQHAERRLEQAKGQLATASKNADQFLRSMQQMKRAFESEHVSTVSVSLTDMSAKMEDEMSAFQKQQISLAISAIASSDIIERMKCAATDRRMRISEKDWNMLTEHFSRQLPQLIMLLQTNGSVTSNERRICMLTLMDIGTLEIGAILNLQSSSVSSAKKSLLTKLTNESSASAKDLKTRIISLLATR